MSAALARKDPCERWHPRDLTARRQIGRSDEHTSRLEEEIHAERSSRIVSVQ